MSISEELDPILIPFVRPMPTITTEEIEVQLTSVAGKPVPAMCLGDLAVVYSPDGGYSVMLKATGRICISETDYLESPAAALLLMHALEPLKINWSGQLSTRERMELYVLVRGMRVIINESMKRIEAYSEKWRNPQKRPSLVLRLFRRFFGPNYPVVLSRTEERIKNEQKHGND